MKKCSKCNLIKSESEFYQKKYRKAGALRADCKACFKNQMAVFGQANKEEISDYKRQYYCDNASLIKLKRKVIRDEKAEIIGSIKRGPCCDCGKCFASCAMDFDHRDRTEKRNGISRILNTAYSVAVLKVELNKCDLVCANCHRDRTHKYAQINKVGKRRYPNRETKQQFIDAHKNKPCVDCCESFNPWQMDFDHIDRSAKLFKLSKSKVLKCTMEQILEEIKKCELVCVNCHRVRHQWK
jgi:hypothetical protein